MAKYNLDPEDQSLVESVLGMAQQIVDLQYDETIGDDLQQLLVNTAELFGISQQEVRVTENDDGTVTVYLEDAEDVQPLKNTKPKLVSIDGGKYREPLPPGFTSVFNDDGPDDDDPIQ